MRGVINKFSNWFLKISLVVCATSVFAALPKPPDSDMASGNKNWIDVGGTLVNKILNIGCIALGAIILVGVAGGIMKAYHTAHERQDLGHFFKMLLVGLLAAAVGMGLVYAGYQIVGVK